MADGICLIGGIYPPDAGGPSKFLWEFENYLLDRGSQVSILVLTDAPSSVAKTSQLTKVRITRNSTLPLRIFNFIRQLRLLKSNNSRFLVAGAFIEVLLSNLSRSSFVVVKIPGDIVWERARNLGMTNLDIISFQELKLPLKFQIMRKVYTRALNSADKVIVPSEGLRKLTELWGINQSRVITIFNSVDVQKYSGDNGKSIASDLLTVCRLTAWKGVDELILAASALNLTLTVIGDGPERENLEKLASSLNAKVTFLGELDSEDVMQHYKKARRFVLNSSYEGLPHVLLEARASRLFCLAREGTGSSEVISHLYDGILFGGENGLSLTEALQLSFSNEVSEDEFVNRAYTDICARFNQIKNFDRILTVLTNE